MLIPVAGDIVQSSYGSLYRANGDGTFDNASADPNPATAPKVTIDDIDAPALVVRNGEAFPGWTGSPMTVRLALLMHRRYEAFAAA